MTCRIVVADSAVQRALVRRAIGLSSDGGLMCSVDMGGGANGVVGSMCTLGSDCTLGGVGECGDDSESGVSTLGAAESVGAAMWRR